MTGRPASDSRHGRAERALLALGGDLAEHQLFNVQCPRSHHVAAVFSTPSGLVYRALTGPHAHGSRDRVDTAHHGHRRGLEYVDMLDAGPGADDEMPAWCDCGPRTLSRIGLLAHSRLGHRTVYVP